MFTVKTIHIVYHRSKDGGIQIFQNSKAETKIARRYCSLIQVYRENNTTKTRPRETTFDFI